jgi:hypothetical protein
MPYSEYSPKQKRLAAVRPPRKKITDADTKAIKRSNRGGLIAQNKVIQGYKKGGQV